MPDEGEGIVTGIGLINAFDGDGASLINSIEFLMERPVNDADSSITLCTKPRYWKLINAPGPDNTILSTVTLFYPDELVISFEIEPSVREIILEHVRQLCCIESFAGTLR